MNVFNLPPWSVLTNTLTLSQEIQLLAITSRTFFNGSG